MITPSDETLYRLLGPCFPGKELVVQNTREVNFDVDYSRFTLVVKTNELDRVVATWDMQQMPACCGVCISSNTHVRMPYLRKGVGKALSKLKIEIANQGHYGLLLVADKDDNTPQRKIMASVGWRDVYWFQNPKTEHGINVSVYDLTKPPRTAPLWYKIQKRLSWSARRVQCFLRSMV